MILHERRFPLAETPDEFRLWTQWLRPLLTVPSNLSPNVLSICEYGFTEVFNNAVDHSRGRAVDVRLTGDADRVAIEIEDDGIGIFNSLQEGFHLDSELHSAIELVKGKLTTAPAAHSGEGLFFASKMFDRFAILSGSIGLSFAGSDCTVASHSARAGTLVRMEIAPQSATVAEAVFNHYCDPNSYVFCRTRFVVALASLEGELVSRSQARRVAARFEQFSVVEVDFTGVSQIGQGFADELLRVWPLGHPQTRLEPVNAKGAVAAMIAHVRGRNDLPQPEQP